MLINVICRIMSGRSANLTHTPDKIINDNQGIYDAAYKLTNAAAVTVKTGAKYPHINGKV